MDVEDLFLTEIPDDSEIILGTDLSSIFGGFLKSKLKKIFASFSSRIMELFCRCGTPNFSRIFFTFLGYSIEFSFSFVGCKISDNSDVVI